MLRIISAEQVLKLLPIKEAISAMKAAFIQLSSGQAQAPIRTHLNFPEQKSEALFMPSYLPDLAQTGLKIVGLCQENPSIGLPFIMANMLVMDARTGQLKGLLEAGSITALRTGAASGLATDLLARKDAQNLVMFGAGAQAAQQIKAVCAVRQIEKVWVFDRDAEKALDFASNMQDNLNLPFEANPSRTVLRSADIISTATTSQRPLFEPEEIAPGTHINAIGAYRKDMAEIHPKVLSNSKVFIDQIDACLAEAGDIIQAIEKGDVQKENLIEIGNLAKDKNLGRTSAEEITCFKSVGNAVQDLAAASAILDRAEELNIGQLIEF